MASMKKPRPQRRRVERRSEAEYDRSPERTQLFGDAASGRTGYDAGRSVDIDGDGEPELTGKAFYEYERPPHYGE